MTEAEWLATNNPWQMVNDLYGKVSDRKLRLYACGCCRLAWPDLSRFDSSRAVELAEQYADGEIPLKELVRAGKAADSASSRANKAGREKPDGLLHYAARAVAFASAFDAALYVEGRLRQAFSESTVEVESPVHARLLRDVIGNPFRPVTFDPGWRTSTVVALAEAIYADRAFDRLPILADALEDAGCDQPDILTHCRSDGPHVRGCWVVDLPLGKS